MISQNRRKREYSKGLKSSRLSEEEVLLSSAKIAASKAVRSSRAMGITIKVIKRHEIIAISPDNSEKVLRYISKPTIDLSVLKKGTVLVRK